MVKVADALTAKGYRVRVVSARYADWATRLDEHVRSTRTWAWNVVDHGRATAPLMWLRSGTRLHIARLVTRPLEPSRCPLPLVMRAWGRIHSELLEAALSEPADLFYGGTSGGLSVAAMAGRRAGKPYALDLEDFHTGELENGPDVRFYRALIERIEREILPGAAFLTAAGPAITDAYARKYGLKPVCVNNTFPLPACVPNLSVTPTRPLRLYWFSQTIGPNRGLEDAVRATALAQIETEMYLQGNPVPGYIESLRALATRMKAALQIVIAPPASPDNMLKCAAGCDVGLALEEAAPLSRNLCLTNKVLAYLVSGLAVVLTHTEGQRPLILDLGQHAITYFPGDFTALASGLRRWVQDRTLLLQAKVAAWSAAKRRWHWDHPLEKGAMLEAVARTLHV